MADAPVTLRTRKFLRNPLLARKQMVVDILHPNRANISKDELRGKLSELYKSNKDQVSVFGLRTVGMEDVTVCGNEMRAKNTLENHYILSIREVDNQESKLHPYNLWPRISEAFIPHSHMYEKSNLHNHLLSGQKRVAEELACPQGHRSVSHDCRIFEKGTTGSSKNLLRRRGRRMVGC
ncbi:40S ribosomal protein S24-B [Emergomyces africanus]|uniref:40S ribosomal protein S24-B n=1 Tax=Emergomyces africanus TaxID=1955775 RepID=A0A1B7NW82_9EURO|nr:40S ribosomal protein S24-B [Emergomyces africanus]